jgi:CTP:phosphocholine cytidylyltransferase-like protein
MIKKFNVQSGLEKNDFKLNHDGAITSIVVDNLNSLIISGIFFYKIK